MAERKFVIDIGTNSVRLMEAEVVPGGIRTVSKQLDTVRIGEGVDKARRLSPAAIERGVGAVRRFWQSARGRGEIFAYATSAVRDAVNREEFLSRVRAETGIRVDLLSGREEAVCGARGALQGKDGATLDIGGGSTELAVVQKGHFLLAASVDIGCVRALELFPGEDAPAVRQWAEKAFSSVPYPGAERVYVIGGTATALAAADLRLEVYDPAAVQGHILTKEGAEALGKTLFPLSVEARMRRMFMDEQRAEVIVYGLFILLAFMEHYAVPRVTVSESDNLEGYLLGKLER